MISGGQDKPSVNSRYCRDFCPANPALFGKIATGWAWGVVPVHLNELSPDTARGTFPGFVYQLGNLLASVNATLQAGIASHFGGNFGFALAVVAASEAIIIAGLTAAGTEAKRIVFAKAKAVVS